MRDESMRETVSHLGPLYTVWAVWWPNKRSILVAGRTVVCGYLWLLDRKRVGIKKLHNHKGLRFDLRSRFRVDRQTTRGPDTLILPKRQGSVMGSERLM